LFSLALMKWSAPIHLGARAVSACKLTIDEHDDPAVTRRGRQLVCRNKSIDSGDQKRLLALRECQKALGVRGAGSIVCRSRSNRTRSLSRCVTRGNSGRNGGACAQQKIATRNGSLVACHGAPVLLSPFKE